MTTSLIGSPPSGPRIPTEIPDQDVSTIELQLDRFSRAKEAHASWAEMGTECTDFLEGRQWTAEEKQIMIEEGRPMVTLNKIGRLYRLIKGYFSQNQTQTEVKPGNDGIGNEEVAEALNMILTIIDEENLSEWENAEVFGDGITTGRGFFDTRLDFEKNALGTIRERAADPFSTFIDPEATRYNPEDWNFVQQSSWMSVNDVENFYGMQARDLLIEGGIRGQHPVDSDVFAIGDEHEISPVRSYGLDEYDVRSLSGLQYGIVSAYNAFDHLNRDRRLIRVLETQHRVWTEGKFVVNIETGEKRPIPDFWQREKLAQLEEFARATNIPLTVMSGTYKRVRWTVTAADRLLYDDWSLYRDFTVTPYFPYFRRGVTRGMVEDLLDPQRELNKRRSNFLHILTSMAHSGWLYHEDAFDSETEETIENEGGRPGINLKWQGETKPERIQPGVPSRGHNIAEQLADDDIKEIAGINDSALGELDKVQSGRAVEARQKQAVVGAEEYFDNWDRTLEHRAQVRLNIIQDYYTEPRIIEIVGENGEKKQQSINVRGADGSIVRNISSGNYKIALDRRPMTAAFKDAQFEEVMRMRKEKVPIPDDLVIELSSVPRKQELKRRLELQRKLKEEQALLRSGQAAPPGALAPPSAPAA